MRYVGFSEYYHDAALSIINEDGYVEFAAQAERYSKKKNDPLIHSDLWDFVREEDKICYYENFEYKAKHRRSLRGEDGKKHHQCSTDNHELIPIQGSLVYDEFHEHHQSHCATAFYTRPWKDTSDTVMVSIDGVGEFQTAVIYDKDFNLIKEWHYPKSVGLVYTSATKELGLRPLEDEYVVMGLSSYGTPPPEMVQWLIHWWEETSDIAPEISLGLTVDTVGAESKESFNIMRNQIKVWCEQYEDKDFAAGIQKFAEYGIMQIMHEARKHGSKLCYSGGCAQNVVINSIIHGLFDEVHIAVAPTDSGSSLGTAAMTWSKETGKDQLCWSPYSGYNIDREVNVKEVVDHLLEHKVCGLANGKAEFGPRALGNRSLIADVRYDVKDTVNTIKRRQKYRPFAPAILEEHAHEYFEGPMNEYMQYTSKALHDYPSVTHVDGTARVQIVKKDCESIFRKVIEEYYARTGVPMLLNTSLNIRGRPMVNDEHDAELWEQKYGVKVF